MTHGRRDDGYPLDSFLGDAYPMDDSELDWNREPPALCLYCGDPMHEYPAYRAPAMHRRCEALAACDPTREWYEGSADE